jgi:hypothetical protein
MEAITAKNACQVGSGMPVPAWPDDPPKMPPIQQKGNGPVPIQISDYV